jgi:hypothetical protein
MTRTWKRGAQGSSPTAGRAWLFAPRLPFPTYDGRGDHHHQGALPPLADL